MKKIISDNSTGHLLETFGSLFFLKLSNCLGLDRFVFNFYVYAPNNTNICTSMNFSSIIVWNISLKIMMHLVNSLVSEWISYLGLMYVFGFEVRSEFKILQNTSCILIISWF